MKGKAQSAMQVAFGQQPRTCRGQSAMEFLMTYGWAILVMIVVVAVLFYIGVMNPSSSSTNTCTFPPGFSCSSFKLIGHNDGVGGYLDLIVGQATGRTITILNVECSQMTAPIWLDGGKYLYYVPPTTWSKRSENSLSFDDPPSSYSNDFTPVAIPTGESRRLVGTDSDNEWFLCTGSGSTEQELIEFGTGASTQYGQQYKGKIWIRYLEQDTQLTRTVVGDVSGIFEVPPPTASGTPPGGPGPS